MCTFMPCKVFRAHFEILRTKLLIVHIFVYHWAVQVIERKKEKL